MIDDKEGAGEGTPAANHLGDYTDRHFEEGVSLQLQLRDRQEARRSRGAGDDRPTPMAWGWSSDTA